MNTLVLYATKYGAAEKIAKRIAEKMNNAATCNLKSGKVPELDGFDCVIIGGSIYAGGLQKEVKDYAVKNLENLKKKKLGLFVSGLQEERESEYFKDNFPEEILNAAKEAKFLGGAFDPQKAGMLEKLAMKVIAKQTGFIDKIDEKKISDFVIKMG